MLDDLRLATEGFFSGAKQIVVLLVQLTQVQAAVTVMVQISTNLLSSFVTAPDAMDSGLLFGRGQSSVV